MSRESREVLALKVKLEELNGQIKDYQAQRERVEVIIEGLKNQFMGMEDALKIITERPKRVRKPKAPQEPAKA